VFHGRKRSTRSAPEQETAASDEHEATLDSPGGGVLFGIDVGALFWRKWFQIHGLLARR
jgi:hypothetical protein